MAGTRVKGNSTSKPRARRPTRVLGTEEGTAVSSNGHTNAHVALPAWVIPVMINVGVLIAAVGTTYGLMQGEISSAKLQINSLSATLAAQVSRIDAMTKDQERTTRLEERLSYVVTILTEIKSDLREGKNSAAKGSVLPNNSNRP